MKQMKRRVSIGLPVYNGAPVLQVTLDSLLNQSYSDFELIISDNASTDQTEDLCRAYAELDNRVRYYRNRENIGLGRNFNRVFELATGEYFKWASSDDLCKPDYLSRCVEVLDRDPDVVLAYPKTTFIDETGKILEIQDPGWDLRSEAPHERLRYVIFSGHWVNSILGLIRAKTLSRTRLLPSYPGGDYRLLGELSLMGRFFEVPEYLYLRRLHPRSSSQNTKNIQWMLEYHLGGRGRICLPSWNLSADHFLTIIRSELSVRHKFSLLNTLLRRMNWIRSDLLQELGTAMKLSTGRDLSPSRGA